MTKPIINQKFVAEQVGVSQSTVSLILSGRKISSEATRFKVVEMAEKLGYRPNLLVHGIQTGKTRMIGVMAAPLDFYWTEVLFGIHDVLSDADHVPINIWISHHGNAFRQRRGQARDPLEQIHRLLDRRIDGVILWPSLASVFQEHIREFSSRNLPVVTVDHELPSEFCADSVGSDETAGGAIAARHFLELGHVRIGHLAGPSDVAWARRRTAAFERALSKMENASCVTIEANLENVEQGFEEALQMLRMPDRPTAIFAATDPLAKSLFRAANELGIRIPQDLSVIGFADDDFAVTMKPPLTTIRQCGYEIGRKAAELVLARSLSNNVLNEVQRVDLPVKMIFRESTGPSPGF